MGQRSGGIGSSVVSKVVLGVAGIAAVCLVSGCADDPKPPPECTADSDCGEGRMCEGGRCLARAAECQSDQDCGEGSTCDSGRCVAAAVLQTAGPLTCLTDRDCPAGQGCVDGACATLLDCELTTVYFDFDDFVLRQDARGALQASAECLKRRPDFLIQVEGHCDERGTEEYNLALGDNRARAVRDYLRDLGLDPSAIDIISYGESRPAVEGRDEAAWSRNRRGELQRRPAGRTSSR